MRDKVICFFLFGLNKIAGTEKSTLAVANGLAISNIIYIYTNVSKEQIPIELHENIIIINLGINNVKKNYLAFFRKLLRQILHDKITHFITVETISLIFTLPIILYIKKIKKIKLNYIVWEHFNFTVNLGKKIRNYARVLASKYADIIVVLTKRDVELWKSNLRIRGHIIAINNPSPFAISENIYSNNSKSIIAIGRLTYQKGFDRLIEIWNEYLKANPNHSDWKLQIIGSGPDEDKLKKIANELDISSNIEFIPNTLKIQSYYENAAFLVMTSRFEGLPMTLIEAQSFGLPIIAYDCLTGPAEIITNDTGFLVKDDDKEGFMNALNILINDNKLRFEISYKVKRSINRFEINNIINDWLIIIK